MNKTFYPDRGEKAWPDGCPCCGEQVRSYLPEGEEECAMWAFDCGCEIVFEEGKPWVNDDCPEAMNLHIDGLLIEREA